MKNLLSLAAALMLGAALNAQALIGFEPGNMAPDLSFPSPKGEAMALSSLKGKMVLIDFWASWCGPCRAENPNVVQAYRLFKEKEFNGGKGFTIFSVSLDRNKEAWINAITADQLEWQYHVSDLGGWQSQAAKQYGVNSIPTNYLIDGNGIILAKNLRGPALLAELQKYQK